MKVFLLLLILIPDYCFSKPPADSSTQVLNARITQLDSVVKELKDIRTVSNPIVINVAQGTGDTPWYDILEGVSTFLTLLFLLFTAYTTRRDVNDLSIVATEIGEQNRLLNAQLRKIMKPMLEIEKELIDLGLSISISLLNKGDKAEIIMIDYYTDDDIEWTSLNIVPLEINQNDTIEFKGNLKKELKSIGKVLGMVYLDRIGNYYSVQLVRLEGELKLFHYETPDYTASISEGLKGSYKAKGEKMMEEIREVMAKSEKRQSNQNL